ncbi:MAG: molybdate ABC transporter substrate-binding protein [Actinomycetota bacterium]
MRFLSRRLAAISVALVGVGFVIGACGDGDAAGENSTELVVLAAASLTESFGDIAEDFEALHDDVEVVLSFGPSDGLATQIIEGAPADVFASASGTWMDAVEADGGPGTQHRTDFARNRLTLITPPDNPSDVRSIEDLGESGIKLVLAAEDVPAGGYARDALANAGVAQQAESNVVSNEEDVKAVIQKVLLGEADAGIVYVTDVTPGIGDDVHAIPIPKDSNVIATYPIAVVAGSDHADLGSEWIRMVTSPQGQAVLHSYHFLPPT